MTIDLSRYLVDQHRTGSTWWLYKFPDGRTASVIPDPRPQQPFRFEVQVDDEEPRRGLGSAEVEGLLAAFAEAVPVPEPEPEPIVALVTVDDHGHLTPESTVTVGEWTWPVPERAEAGGVLWMARVVQVLREHGVKVLGEPRRSAEPGIREVPVRKIESNEA